MHNPRTMYCGFLSCIKCKLWPVNVAAVYVHMKCMPSASQHKRAVDIFGKIKIIARILLWWHIDWLLQLGFGANKSTHNIVSLFIFFIVHSFAAKKKMECVCALCFFVSFYFTLGRGVKFIICLRVIFVMMFLFTWASQWTKRKRDSRFAF